MEFADAETGDGKTVSIVAAQLQREQKDSYTLSLDGAPTTLAAITLPMRLSKHPFTKLKLYPNPFSDFIILENAADVEKVL